MQPPLSPLSPGDDDVTTPATPPAPLLPTSLSARTPAPFTSSTSSARRKLRVLILSSDTGGGHRASAQSLLAALHRLYPGEIETDVVDFWVDLAEGPFARFPQQYTFMAKRPWLWKLSYEWMRLPPAREVTEGVINALGHRKIRDGFLKYAPDLIVSVHPLVNRVSLHVLAELERVSGVPRVPYVTVVTDLGGAHPTWFDRRADMVYIPTDGVRKVAERVGVERMRQLGLPVREDFWEDVGDAEGLKGRLGLREGYRAVLVVGGGDGVGGLKGIVCGLVEALERGIGEGVEVVVICGKNERVRRWMEGREWGVRVVAKGFVNNMSEWMAACDMICTKAGPGTIAESLIRGLPIVVTGFLPGQEEANVRFVEEMGVGVYARRAERIGEVAVEWLRDGGRLERMSRRARECGRPQAAVEIAADVVDVAKERIRQNVRVMERQRQIRLRAGIGVAEMERLMRGGKSLLAVRIKFLLRVLVAAMLAKRAVSSPPGSPVAEDV